MISLPEPPTYRPYSSGKYTTAPGLHALDVSFGNYEHDGKVFQIDSKFSRFRDNLAQLRETGLDEYVGTTACPEDVLNAASEYMARQLSTEHPSLYSLSEGTLQCKLTGETLLFDDSFTLEESAPYVSGFDALVSQVQEDVVIVQFEEESDRLAAVHVTAPSGWVPSEKLGKDFRGIHKPVPAMEPVLRSGPALLRSLIDKGPFQRFGWGISTHTDLNTNPHHATHRPFEPDDPQLYIRVERQVFVGLPRVSALMFLIRLHHTDCATLSASEKDALVSVLHSMSDDTRRYKGLYDDFDAITDWLKAGA